MACAPPDIGMHPTADTPLVVYFQRPGAAGVAGRYAASLSRELLTCCNSVPGGAILPHSSTQCSPKEGLWREE